MKFAMKAKLVDEDGAFTLVELGENHNHEDMEGSNVAEKIQREIKEVYEKDFRKTPGEINQQVMNKYKVRDYHCQALKSLKEVLLAPTGALYVMMP